jgi:hypothetical protein
MCALPLPLPQLCASLQLPLQSVKYPLPPQLPSRRRRTVDWTMKMLPIGQRIARTRRLTLTVPNQSPASTSMRGATGPLALRHTLNSMCGASGALGLRQILSWMRSSACVDTITAGGGERESVRAAVLTRNLRNLSE